MSTPVNPYEPSAHVSEPVRPSPITDESPGPHYASRLDWSDRRALLKSLGPIRLSVVIGGLYWLRSIAYYASALANIVTRHDQFDGPSITFSAFAACWLLLGVLHLYTYRLDWLYAESLQSLAGGRTPSHRDWTRLHLRTWRLSALIWILFLALTAADWLVRRLTIAAAVGL